MNSDSGDSELNLSTKPRLGMCEVCASKLAKYTCPKCELKTCCMQCIKIHKQEIPCDGVRDKVKFLPLKSFTNLDLSSDYKLLEEIGRSVDNLKKNSFKSLKHKGKELPPHLHRLRKAAQSRQIYLNFLPKSFTRRRENKSYLDFKQNIIMWQVNWVFTNADNFTVNDVVPENNKLSNLIHKYLITQGNRNLNEKLQYYSAADIPGIKFFLKAEQKAGCKYYELDPLLNLKNNLNNKIIIENPIIHVVLKEHSRVYDIIDSDDECDNSQMENGKEIVNNIIKKEKSSSSLKNLLFTSEGEFSDAE